MNENLKGQENVQENEKLSFDELDCIQGGIETGCGLANGDCVGENSGCKLFRGKCRESDIVVATPRPDGDMTTV